jgi:hypothetical protein
MYLLLIGDWKIFGRRVAFAAIDEKFLVTQVINN